MEGVDTDYEEKKWCQDNDIDADVDLSQFDIHKLQLQGIKSCVQNPPPCVFGPRDLRWDLEYRTPRGGHNNSHVV